MIIRSLLLCTIAVLSGCAAFESEPPPQTTSDGLQLAGHDRFDVLYVRPGDDFSRYDSVFIAAPTIEFANDWKKRQNKADPHRVDDEDLEKIKSMVGDQLVEVLTEEIGEGSRLTIAETQQDADLILKLEIEELDIINPLNNQSYRFTVFAENSGSMTINMEISDTNTDKVLLRLKEKSLGRNSVDFQRHNSVRLRADNNRLFRRWAESLNGLLNQDAAPG